VELTTLAASSSTCESVLAASSTTKCTGARRVIHHKVYRCSPRHPPQYTGARRVMHHIVYRCAPCHPSQSVPMLAASSTTYE